MKTSERILKLLETSGLHPETKELIRRAAQEQKGFEDRQFLEWAKNHERVKKEGYAGIMPNGNLVDRREHPEAVPLMKNELLGIPEPMEVG